MNSYDQHNHDMSSMALSVDERTVVATDKSIKVTLNQSNMTKGPVMSVKGTYFVSDYTNNNFARTISSRIEP